jgi:hypothetical protein
MPATPNQDIAATASPQQNPEQKKICLFHMFFTILLSKRLNVLEAENGKISVPDGSKPAFEADYPLNVFKQGHLFEGDCLQRIGRA